MFRHLMCPWRSRACALLALWLAASGAAADTRGNDDIEALRQELAALRNDYQQRIGELEARLDAAERRAQEAANAAQAAAAAVPPAAPTTTTSLAGVVNDRSFNPAIGVIFEGQAWHDDQNPDHYQIPGFPLSADAGAVPRGLAIGETELNFSANVDDLFTAWLTTPIVVQDGDSHIEVEEAWIETLGLPAGLSARFGRFYSGVGYLNSKHSHTWDFIDQPLVYQAFLGNQYLDDGVQVRWLAPTPVFLEVGAEALRGSRYPAAGAADSGFGAHSLFVHAGGDVGTGQSWLAGLSYLHAQSRGRESGPAESPVEFDGRDDLIIADLVWKWAPRGNWRQRNLVFQTEAMWRNEDGSYLLGGPGPSPVDRDQSGWYAQLVYQPIPQWRVGARYDRLSTGNGAVAFAGTPLEAAGSNPERYSFMVDWSHSEFSRLRLQYSRDLTGPTDDDQWGLEYIFSIGAHGAHTF